MNTETIMQLLELLFGPGCIAAFWVWIKTRENRKALASKERDDTYKQMYDNLSDTLLDLQNENIKLYKAVRLLNRTIQKATTCVHYSVCPLRDELQDNATVHEGTDSRPIRQPARNKKARSLAGTRSREPGQPAAAV